MNEQEDVIAAFINSQTPDRTIPSNSLFEPGCLCVFFQLFLLVFTGLNDKSEIKTADQSGSSFENYFQKGSSFFHCVLPAVEAE